MKNEKELSRQEKHNLAMNIVGKELEEAGYEFLGVNSKLQLDPQFVVTKEKQMSFIVVRAVSYPQDPEEFDKVLLEKVKKHAEKFEARTFYAGVGLGHGDDYGKPILRDEAYTVLFKGLQEIL